MGGSNKPCVICDGILSQHALGLGQIKAKLEQGNWHTEAKANFSGETYVKKKFKWVFGFNDILQALKFTRAHTKHTHCCLEPNKTAL